MSYKTIILVTIRTIFSGTKPTEAVYQIALKYGLNFEKLWGLLPDIYKYEGGESNG